MAVMRQKELLDMHPDEPDMKFDMFEKLKNKGYDKHAINFCRETTSAHEVVRFYNNRGVMDSKKGDPERALDGYKDALKFYPDHEENYRIHFNIALAIINKKEPGHRKMAIREVEKCLALNPEFEKGQKLLAKLKDVKSKQSKAS